MSTFPVVEREARAWWAWGRWGKAKRGPRMGRIRADFQRSKTPFGGAAELAGFGGEQGEVEADQGSAGLDEGVRGEEAHGE